MQMSIAINPVQRNEMLHNGYLLVELRLSMYTVLEGSVLYVALGDNIHALLTCT